jgi:hypothetical protein
MPSTPTTRKRKLPWESPSGSLTRRVRATGSVDLFETASAECDGAQTTVSTGHPFKFEFKGRDEGGDFYTTKTYAGEGGLSNSPASRIYNLSTTHRPGLVKDLYYSGPLFPGDSRIDFNRLFPPDDMASSTADLFTKGATAIARCKPGQPVVDLSTSLAELYREGLPSILGASQWKEKTNIIRGAGSEYLNYVFGWAPLISDIRGTAHVLTHFEEMMTQYERDAGNLIRRGYRFDDERSFTSETVANTQPWGVATTLLGNFVGVNMTNSGSFAGCTTRVEKETHRSSWFSGAFTYYLPADYYSRNKMRKAAAEAKILLGIELTPEVLWNLAPWSWLADWVANYGDVLSNVSDFASGQLVMPYGYMMEHTWSTNRYIMEHHGLRGVPDPLIWSFSRETKQRVKASPFGFGLNWNSFSPKQLAILASIGITR